MTTARKLVDVLIKANRHIIVLVDRVQHLKDVDDIMEGITRRLVYGKISIDDRTEAKLLFEDEDAWAEREAGKAWSEEAAKRGQIIT